MSSVSSEPSQTSVAVASDDARAAVPRGALGALLRSCRATSRLFAWIGGGAILLSAFPVCIDVVTRAVLKQTWLYSYEMSSYLFAVATAFSFAFAVFSGSHVRIDLLRGRLSALGYWVLDVLAYFALASVAIALAHSAWTTFGESLKLGARSASTLGFPLTIPQGLWAAGISWFAFVTVAVLATLLVNGLRRRFATADRILAQV